MCVVCLRAWGRFYFFRVGVCVCALCFDNMCVKSVFMLRCVYVTVYVYSEIQMCACVFLCVCVCVCVCAFSCVFGCVLGTNCACVCVCV
jgi:hypothetical protein